MPDSSIEWTDITDNIITVKGGGWWCRKLSPGCANCYAAALNQNSFYNGNKLLYTGKPPELILRHNILERWPRMKSPKRHFVSSMTDIFGDWVPREWIFTFLAAMAASPLQTFQLLTKRPEIAARETDAWLDANPQPDGRLPRNIQVGASIEDQPRADERIPHLLNIKARVRFLSCEPLIGPLKLKLRERSFGFPKHITRDGAAVGMPQGIHWVICGGESGKNARPMHPDWARSLRDQCAAASVPFLFKQWGEWLPICETPATSLNPMTDWHSGKRSTVLQIDGRQSFEFPPGAMTCIKLGKKHTGRLLDGQLHHAFPQP